MSGKHPVPLIRPRSIAPVFAELSEAGVLQNLLLRVKLPGDLFDRLDEFVPAHTLLHFMAEAAGYFDAPDLAFCATSQAEPEQMGQWGLRIAQCYTLRSALKHLCVVYPLEAPFLQMGLVEGKTHAWLWRHRKLVQKDPLGEIQGEQITLSSMIQAVRMAAGCQWNPPAVLIESPKSEWALHTEGLVQSRVAFGGSVLAIAIPCDLLDRRLPLRPSRRTASEDASAPAAGDLVGSLIQALMPIAMEIPLSLDLGAEIAETSPRTLRRWLAEEGTSWRHVVDRVRFASCLKLMEDSSIALTEVSMKLGYSDQAHFTRAFHRWTGESPGVYRCRRASSGSQFQAV